MYLFVFYYLRGMLYKVVSHCGEWYFTADDEYSGDIVQVCKINNGRSITNGVSYGINVCYYN